MSSTHHVRCNTCATILSGDRTLKHNQRKTRWVLLLTTLMMIGEIVAGYLSHSMALTADGFHMASHAGALMISLTAYRLASSENISRKFSFGPGKLIPLGGYTSAVVLAIVALMVFIESASRLFSPVSISYNEAIFVAALGLAVNVVCALILNHEESHAHDGHENHAHGEHRHHHHHDVHDHNIRSAFLHILADAVTSVLALGALFAAKQWHFTYLDPMIGIVGALLILAWATQLLRDTGWELLDGHSKAVDWPKLKSRIESDGAEILDFHAWRIAPKSVSCELVVASSKPRGLDHYRQILREEFHIHHMIIEERQILC